MAGAFASGFRLGGDMFNQAERVRLAQEATDLAKAQDARSADLHRATMAEKADAARTRDQQFGLRTEMTDRVTGFDRAGYNKAADADFDAALAASDASVKAENVARSGLMPPGAMQPAAAAETPAEPPMAYRPPQVSNADAELGLRASNTKAPDVSSPEYRSQMAGLRSRYALASGDMADFDRVNEGERNRITSKEDADAVLAIQKDPMGAAAREARTFVNDKSRSLSVDTDPKTGISTFRIIKGDSTKPVEVSPTDLGKIAVGVRRLQRGDVAGLDVISGVSKELAAAVREEFKEMLDVGKANNDGVAKIEKIKTDREEVGIKRGAAAATAKYYADRGTTERMGSAQYFTGADGNTYASIPKMGKTGVVFETVKVNPEGVKLNKVGGGGPSKPVEVPEQGKIMMRDGKRFMTDGLGGEIEVNARGKALGVMPDARDEYLTKTLGMAPAMANELEYSKDGRYILAPNGVEYDTQAPQDMKRIKDEIIAFAAQDPVDYENRMLLSKRPAPTGFGPKITNRPAEGAPSIYAGPEAWAAYRARQQQQ